jgi:hypothetical protein
VAFVVLQDVIGLKEKTTAPAAIAYGISPLLPIGNGMDQPRCRCLLEDIFCLFLADLPAQAIVNNVMAQLAEVEADLKGMIAIRRVRIQVFSLATRTVGDCTVILRIHILYHILVR